MISEWQRDYNAKVCFSMYETVMCKGMHKYIELFDKKMQDM